MVSPGSLASLFSAIVPSAFGAVGIRTDGDYVRELTYLPQSFAFQAPANALAENAANQVTHYLSDPDFRFDLPLLDAGSPFQRRVWAAISKIPRGSVMTYGAIAREIGSAPRAVGQACGANWFPLIVPCHRVTSATGLGGFANCDEQDAFHAGVKRWLLAHDGVLGRSLLP